MAAASLWGRKDVQFVAALLHVCACTRACFHSGTLPDFIEQWLSLLSSIPYLLSLSPFFIPLRWDLCIEQNQSCNWIHPFWRVLRTVVWYNSCWGEALPAAALWRPVLLFLFSPMVLLPNLYFSVIQRTTFALKETRNVSEERWNTSLCVLARVVICMGVWCVSSSLLLAPLIIPKKSVKG